VKISIVELGASFIEGLRDKVVEFIPSNPTLSHSG
jgi:hypothetical protein